ncbi:hypothetical protein E2C01_052949 [Portunus trituberculatus]|uniref:Uncharacterized protein n=1 Tax=Portunus trituberculatus TaxID=210409 RepID=A0A5B7GNT3_PORTR|nr:hypothetical protein [Portunus trituberculatus]
MCCAAIIRCADLLSPRPHTRAPGEALSPFHRHTATVEQGHELRLLLVHVTVSLWFGWTGECRPRPALFRMQGVEEGRKS